MTCDQADISALNDVAVEQVDERMKRRLSWQQAKEGKLRSTKDIVTSAEHARLVPSAFTTRRTPTQQCKHPFRRSETPQPFIGPLNSWPKSMSSA